MARVTGLEPATSGVTGRHSNRLSYTRALLSRKPFEEVARVTGLEPATSGVTGRHSNQLSYTRIPSFEARLHACERLPKVSGPKCQAAFMTICHKPRLFARTRLQPIVFAWISQRNAAKCDVSFRRALRRHPRCVRQAAAHRHQVRVRIRKTGSACGYRGFLPARYASPDAGIADRRRHRPRC